MGLDWYLYYYHSASLTRSFSPGSAGCLLYCCKLKLWLLDRYLSESLAGKEKVNRKDYFKSAYVKIAIWFNLWQMFTYDQKNPVSASSRCLLKLNDFTKERLTKLLGRKAEVYDYHKWMVISCTADLQLATPTNAHKRQRAQCWIEK